MKMLDALNWRYAVKKFSDDKISSPELVNLLEAVRLSASSYGLQPYNIIVVESKPIRERLVHYSYGQDKVAKSSHLLVFAAHTNIGDVTVDRYINKYVQLSNKSRSELHNYAEHIKSALSDKTSEQKQEWAHQQAYIALGNLLTCAAVMKIDSCPMSGFDRDGYDAELGLNKKGLTTTVICPIGRRHPEDTWVRLPKVRFDYDEIVMGI